MKPMLCRRGARTFAACLWLIVSLGIFAEADAGLDAAPTLHLDLFWQVPERRSRDGEKVAGWVVAGRVANDGSLVVLAAQPSVALDRSNSRYVDVTLYRLTDGGQIRTVTAIETTGRPTFDTYRLDIAPDGSVLVCNGFQRITKIASGGMIDWAISLAAISHCDAIKLLEDGGALVIGGERSRPGEGVASAHVFQLDRTGNLLWHRQIAVAGDDVYLSAMHLSSPIASLVDAKHGRQQGDDAQWLGGNGLVLVIDPSSGAIDVKAMPPPTPRSLSAYIPMALVGSEIETSEVVATAPPSHSPSCGASLSPWQRRSVGASAVESTVEAPEGHGVFRKRILTIASPRPTNQALILLCYSGERSWLALRHSHRQWSWYSLDGMDGIALAAASALELRRIYISPIFDARVLVASLPVL